MAADQEKALEILKERQRQLIVKIVDERGAAKYYPDVRPNILKAYLRELEKCRARMALVREGQESSPKIV